MLNSVIQFKYKRDLSKEYSFVCNQCGSITVLSAPEMGGRCCRCDRQHELHFPAVPDPGHLWLVVDVVNDHHFEICSVVCNGLDLPALFEIQKRQLQWGSVRELRRSFADLEVHVRWVQKR